MSYELLRVEVLCSAYRCLVVPASVIGRLYFLYLSTLHWHLCCLSVDHVCLGQFLDSLFCFPGACLFTKTISMGNSLVVQWLGTRLFHCHGPGSVTGWATKILQAVWHDQKNCPKSSTVSSLLYIFFRVTLGVPVLLLFHIKQEMVS